MVLKRFLSSRLSPRNAAHFVPAGQRVYAVGDIHGRLDLLEHLLEEIDADHASRPPSQIGYVFLGDLVDRGPDSCGVIDRLLRLRDSGAQTRFLLGNHDEVFLKAASGDIKAMRFLTRIGGKETILSYGVSKEAYDNADYPELARMFADKVPAAHREFLESFENYAEIGDYLFVHAGIRPGVELANQSTTDLRWIRGEFLNHRDHHGKMVVHGHSISEEPDVRRNRIGIDTGAFASGRLTALGLEGADHWFVTATGEPDGRWQKMTD